jgi:hypothetical protein
MPERISWFKRGNKNHTPQTNHQQEAPNQSDEVRKQLAEQMQAFFTNIDTKVAAKISTQGGKVRQILPQIHEAAPRHHDDLINLAKVDPALHKYIKGARFFFHLDNAQGGPAFLYSIDTFNGATHAEVGSEMPGGGRLTVGVTSRGEHINFDHAHIERIQRNAGGEIEGRTILETYAPNFAAGQRDVPLRVKQTRGGSDDLQIILDYTNIDGSGNISLRDQHIVGANAGKQCSGTYSTASSTVTWYDRMTAPNTEVGTDSITFSNSQDSTQELIFPKQDNLFTRIQETTQRP